MTQSRLQVMTLPENVEIKKTGEVKELDEIFAVK